MSQQLQDGVMKALGTVIEPEFHKDLVTLNMVRNLTINNDVAQFTIMLTTPACPLKDVIHKAARAAVVKVPGIREVDIKWDANVPSNPRVVHGRIDIAMRNIIAVGSGKG